MRGRRSPRRLLAFALAGVLVGGGLLAASVTGPLAKAEAASAPSSMGSIVFIRGHNIWVARGNGSSATQVTRDGTSAKPYENPSMSNTGVIATVRGNDIVLFKQNGTLIRRIAVPKGNLFLNNGAGSYAVTGPIEAEISPDGSKIAYREVRYATAGSWADTRTGFTDTTGLSPITKYGIVLYDHFSWLGNSRGVLGGSIMRLYQLGSDLQLGVDWFEGADVTGESIDFPQRPQVSRDGRLLVWMNYSGGLIVTEVNGDPVNAPMPPAPPLPSPVCGLSPSDAQPLSHPNFAPDSSTLLWQESGTEVWVGWDLQLSPGCAGMKQKRLLANATHPAWSAAAFNVTPEKTRPAVTQSLKLKKRPRIKGKARVGRTLVATKGTWTRTPTVHQYRWLRNGKVIKGKAGAKKKYVVRRGDKGKRISVRVTVRKSGLAGKRNAVSKPVKVR